MRDVVIIGAGQAGLSVAYYLQQRKIDALVIERFANVGDTWRQRYDSLMLFTPSQYSGLPAFPVPLPPDRYLTKDQIANYFEAYSKWFHFDIALSTTVNRVARSGDFFEVHTSTGIVKTKAVVAATSALNGPYIPEFAANLNPRIFQIHSSSYRNPDQLPPGDVLVVGVGNSGAQIAEELAATREVYMSFENMAKVRPQRRLGMDIFWWAKVTGQWGKVVKSNRPEQISESANRIEKKRLRRSMALIGSALPKLLEDGRIKRKGRAVAARNGNIVFADSSELAPTNIVWGTGFSHDFDWIDLPTFDHSGFPLHTRGVSQEPGLYFIGLPFLHTLTSTVIGYVGEDAKYLVSQIAGFLRSPS